MHVFLIAAITADGYIGRDANDRSFDWTSQEDKQFYVKSIKRAKAVVMGLRTFKTFTRYPKGNRYILYTNRPEEFINPKPEVIEAMATKEDPKVIIEQLEAEGFSEVAIAGGASIYTLFLKAGVIDTLYLTVEPILFGKGVPLFTEEVSVDLELKNCTQLSPQTLLVEYKVKK